MNNCVENNWLYDDGDALRTMMPGTFEERWDCVFNIILGNTCSHPYYSSDSQTYYVIKPVLYLKSNIKIKNGDGTIDNSYQLSIE